MFERMDRDKAELKKEINDVALLILAKLEPCVCEENSKPKILIQPMTKKK